MITQLEIRPGSVVFEAGSGSGSLTHALARTVMPTGRVVTCEFHELRQAQIAKEVVAHNLSDVVTSYHADVIECGFPEAGIATAIVLDLPQPWRVISKLGASWSSSGGRLCLFSPCIEQVQRSCSTLMEEGYTDIETMECLQRDFDIIRCQLPMANTGQCWMQPFVSDGNTKVDNNIPSHHGKAPVYSFASEEKWRALPKTKAQGHTGFLTFATFVAYDG